MKRLVLCLGLCGLLAVPALAIARPFPPDSHFQGHIERDPNTYFGFGTSGSKHHKQVRHLAVALPMNCFDGTQGIEQVRIHGHFDLENLRDLITTSVQTSASAAKPSGVITPGQARAAKRDGVITPERARAVKGAGSHIPRSLRHLKIFYGKVDVKTDEGSGKASLYGEVKRHGKARGYIHMRTHSSQFGDCYSGGLKWRAHRGAHVDYPPAP